MAEKESKLACFNLAAQLDTDLADSREKQINHFGMPVLQTADDFMRGMDIILDAQQQFLSATASPSESAKSKSFGAATK